MTQVGEAFVRVRPLATGFGPELDKQTAPALRRFENNLGGANREVGRFSRGALVGTGALRGLGRAAAFASGTFIGGAGLTFAIKSSVDAAMEAQAVLAQTENAVKRSGLSWDQYGEQVKAAALAQANISGFDDERLLATFSTLVRRTGDVTKAIQLNSLATDVARGRNIQLEAATQLVLKASLGMGGALRRLGIDAKSGASGIQLIQLLSDKYAGSAARFGETAAGAQARFDVALRNTEEIIGAAVLPSITKLLNTTTDWLNNTKNQKKIQDDLNASLRVTTQVAGGVASAIGFIGDAWNKLPNFGKHQGLLDILPGGNVSLLNLLGIGNSKGSPLSPGQLALALAPLSPLSGNAPAGAFNGPGVFGANTPPDQFQFGGARPSSAQSTRDQITATNLAKAQAGGIRSQITAAANTRLAFINDTIAFANKLIAQGRGDTAKLQATLQKFYGEKGSVEGIVQGFIDQDTQNAKDRAAKAKAAAEAALASAKQAREQGLQNAVLQAEISNDPKAERSALEKVVGYWRGLEQTFKKGTADYADAHNNYLTAIQTLNSFIQQGTTAQQAANAETQRLLIEQQNQSRQGYKDYLAQEEQRKLGNLENNVLEAQLIQNPERERTAELTAQELLVKYYKRLQDKAKKNTVEYTNAHRDYLTALKAFDDLRNRDKQASGYSLEQLFEYAGSQFAQYGSNVGDVLSSQDARGAYGGIVSRDRPSVAKTSNTIVVQHFNYPVSSSQALNDAHAGAKNLK